MTKIPANRPRCADDADQVHVGYAPTGRTTPSNPGRPNLEVWACQCGDATMDVKAGTPIRW
jgi:hypothetical protein